MKRLVTFFLLASSLAFVGCNNFVDKLAVAEALDHAKNTFAEYPVYGECVREPLIGTGVINKNFDECITIGEFSIVIEEAHGSNRVVLKRGIEIPILGIVTWQYFGIDFSEADHKEWTGLGDEEKVSFLAYKIMEGFYKYGFLGYEPADHDFFWDNHGVETLFSENTASIKDVELMGTKVEDQNAVSLGEKFSAQYGLSNERGQAVAKTIAAYNKLASKRSLTLVEKDQFSTNLLGVDYKTALKGFQGGDAKELEALMEQAAKTNGTTPEAVSAIVRDMVL